MAGSKYFETGYVYDPEIIKELNIERTQVEDDGECKIDFHAEGSGCHLYTCSSCNEIKKNIYIVGS